MSISFPARRLIIDHRRKSVAVEARDGTLVVEPLRNAAPSGALGILRSEYVVDARELHLTLPAGDRVTIDVGPIGLHRRRPIVYLDQNHWITLARHRYAPDKQADALNDAARQITAWAHNKNIILPLSSAHAVETARSDGRFRHHLATTMLSLSHGWQLRSPLAVRAFELAAGMRAVDAAAPDVVTLDPGALFAPRQDAEPDTLLPYADFLERVSWVSGFFDVMIEDEKEHPPEAQALAAKWARIHYELARKLREDRVSKSQVREIALTYLLTDLHDAVARAGLDAGLPPAAFFSWLQTDADAAIATMPHLGRYRELVLRRLRNADERWEPNDFIDATFLSCAAGYVDIVVGEKKHTNLLMQTQKHAVPGAHLTWKLPEAVDWLETNSLKHLIH
jgi:hypothetical protein